MMLQPESRGHRSYYEAFTRRRNLTPDVLARENLLTDRGAYLNFLEVQLERVSAACLVAQDIGARVENVTAQACAAEDKVLSATKLVRLSQTYSEEQGREQARINDAFEERLSHLERNVDAISSVLPDSKNFHILHSNDHGDQHAERQFSSQPSPAAYANEPLSRWMIDVDNRISELQKSAAVSQDEAVTAAAAADTESGVGARRETQVANGSRADDDGNDRRALATDNPPISATPVELVHVEARLRRLEDGLAETELRRHEDAPGTRKTKHARTQDCEEVAGQLIGSSAGGTKLDDMVREESRGRARESGCDQTRDRSRSHSKDIETQSNGGSGKYMAVEEVEEPTATTLLEVVEAGREEARKACKAAEKALKVGKEAAERSERTESLAKTMAVRSMKFSREQHDQVNNVLARLVVVILLPAEGHVQHKRTLEELTTDLAARGFELPIVGEQITAGVHDVTKERARIRTGRSADPDRNYVADGDISAMAPALRDIQSMLDEIPVKSDDSRRTALNAARSVLESILRESSPSWNGRRVDGGRVQRDSGKFARAEREIGIRGGRGRDGSGQRSSDANAEELREAISGAVHMLSGLSGSRLPGERQRHSARCSRRGSRSESRPIGSRDRAVTPPRRERERLAGYWIPPGNLPSKVGERRKLGSVRVAWDGREDDAEE